MREHIEREKVYDIFSTKQQALLKYHRYYQLNDADKEEFDLYDSYMDEVESIPASDVSEVVHGEWIRRQFADEPTAFGYRCSECHLTYDFDTNYCPNCGADMRGDKND